MKITVTMEGRKELSRRISRLNLVARAQVKDAVAESAINVQRYAKRNCPVDTGRLRASINAFFFQNGMTGEVGTNVEYAPHIEFGTMFSAAQPFLFPAWERERPNYIKNIESIFKELENKL